MKFSRSIHAVDSHTMGEPTRVVVGGIPQIPGNTMAEKKRHLETHLDYLRTSLMHEPRGHNDMFGSILTTACNSDADFGIIFMDGGGYLNMCGHGSIGAATVAVETGIVTAIEPVTEVVMESPAGIIHAQVTVKNQKVQGVSIVNVPSFLYKADQKISVPDYGIITVDIAFGGSFFAIVDAQQLNIELVPKNITVLKKLGLQIRHIVNEKIAVQHPLLEHIKSVDLVEFYDKTDNPQADLRNVVVFGQGQVDRSPCGTGTSAKIATLFAKGRLKQNEEFVYESITHTLFKGSVIGTTTVGELSAVIPQIVGCSYITGFSQYVIDDDDPVKYGFRL